MDLYSEPIEVELPAGAVTPSPTAFTCRGERHAVVELLSAWQDAGFPSGARRRSWLERRHRNYFRVRTEDESVWEVYLERGSGRRKWYVSRRWNPGEEA
jgi:hypothetical protein